MQSVLPLTALLLALPLMVQAQSPSADAHSGAAVARAERSDTLTPLDFSIPPLPLRDALREFTRQSGVQVRIETNVPAVTTTGLVGRFTAPQALRRLIAGTGLAAVV